MSEQSNSAAARLSRDTAEFATEQVRTQVRDLVQSLADPLRLTGRGTLLLLAAGAAGGLALATVHVALLRAAEAVMPRPAAAMTVAALYGAAAAAAGLAAREQLRAAAEKSEAAVKGASEDADPDTDPDPDTDES